MIHTSCASLDDYQKAIRQCYAGFDNALNTDQTRNLMTLMMSVWVSVMATTDDDADKHKRRTAFGYGDRLLLRHAINVVVMIAYKCALSK